MYSDFASFLGMYIILCKQKVSWIGLPGNSGYLINGHRAILSCVVFIANTGTIDTFTVKRAVIWT